MVSFVEAQNSLKRVSHRGCVTQFKTRQSQAVASRSYLGREVTRA